MNSTEPGKASASASNRSPLAALLPIAITRSPLAARAKAKALPMPSVPPLMTTVHGSDRRSCWVMECNLRTVLLA